MGREAQRRDAAKNAGTQQKTRRGWKLGKFPTPPLTRRNRFFQSKKERKRMKKLSRARMGNLHFKAVKFRWRWGCTS
jgi:hypothetical protein